MKQQTGQFITPYLFLSSSQHSLQRLYHHNARRSLNANNAISTAATRPNLARFLKLLAAICLWWNLFVDYILNQVLIIDVVCSNLTNGLGNSIRRCFFLENLKTISSGGEKNCTQQAFFLGPRWFLVWVVLLNTPRVICDFSISFSFYGNWKFEFVLRRTCQGNRRCLVQSNSSNHFLICGK